MGCGIVKLAATAAAAMALAWTPVAQADSRFITVALPADADLTTYGWCSSLGCDEPQRLKTPDPAAVYSAIIAVEIGPPGDRRVVAFDSYGAGAWATARAVRTLLAATGEPGATTVAAVLLRTPTRPNGGLLTRVNIESNTPPSNFNAFGGGAGPGETVDTSFVDVAREYDGFADFPSWLNPLAVLNALAGAVLLRDYNNTVTWQDPRCPDATCVAPGTWPVTLPTSSGDVYAVVLVPDPEDPANTLAIRSPSPVGVAVIPGDGDQTVYYTQLTPLLPLLKPLQRPFDVVNAAVAAASDGAVRPKLVNPLVQVLEEPLTMLVNLGYTDVDPEAGYRRTLAQPGESISFGTLPNLTLRQWLEVPNDVTQALGDGIAEAVRNPFGLRDTEVRDAEASDTDADQDAVPDVEPANSVAVPHDTDGLRRAGSADRDTGPEPDDGRLTAAANEPDDGESDSEGEPVAPQDEPDGSDHSGQSPGPDPDGAESP